MTRILSQHLEENIKKSILTFNLINNRIDFLIDCSAKDFIILNNNFKEFHTGLKKLADQVMLVIHSYDNYISFRKENQLAVEAKKKSFNILNSIEKKIEFLNNLEKNINYSLFHIHNAKQDLGTLKLITTNLRFDPQHISTYNDTIKKVNQIISFYEKEENMANSFLSEVQQMLSLFESQLAGTSDIIFGHLDKFMQNYEALNQKEEGLKSLSSTVKEIEQKRTMNASEIITNLQFQDILRQKIEHVQEAHHELLHQMEHTLSSQIEEDQKKIRDEVILRVRDIGTLQAAQLIHANQEYQNAVETIINRFGVLNELMHKYSFIWNQLCKPEIVHLKKVYSSMSTDFPEILKELSNMRQIAETIDHKLKKLQPHITQFATSQERHEHIKLEISSLFELYNTEKISDQKKNRSHTIYMKIRRELKAFYNNFKAYSEKQLIQQELDNIKKQVFNADILNLVNLITEDMNAFKEDFDHKNKTHLKAKEVSDLDQFIIEQTDFNINQIEYYEKFDKEVESIISTLNELIADLNIGELNTDTEYLEKVRKSYTMQSERNVHNLIVGKKDDKEESSDDDSEVEFF